MTTVVRRRVRRAHPRVPGVAADHPARGTRAPYSKPQLKRYGNVSVATAGNGAAGSDFAAEFSL
ncbi:MAG TPA: hypothetical protein VFO77_11435 [Actinoplanes sp.]|nr:hypothetical protein [Actinoplanes sp.]